MATFHWISIAYPSLDINADSWYNPSLNMVAAEAVVTHIFLFLAFYFEVFLLVSFLERKLFVKRALVIPTPLNAGAHPHVCIVVPCFNEERTIAHSLESLLALSYPKEKLEIAVVDDGSTDKTYEVALRYAHDPRVNVFRKEQGGKHTALNMVLSHTSAELIGCLDADSTVDSRALLRIVAAFKNPRIAAVTPGIHVRNPRTILQHLQRVEYLLGIFNRYASAGLGSIYIAPGPFSIFRASTIREVGGWRHGHSTEDMELGLRLQNTGWIIANDPRAIVHTITPKNLSALIRQRVRWSYGFLRNVLDYRHMIGSPTYGNLGLVILPAALLSFGAALFFAVLLVWHFAQSIADIISRFLLVGAEPLAPTSLFFFNTSFMWLIVYATIALTVILISLGSFLSTGERRLPYSTPLFLVFYSLLTPIWLGIALARAIFNTGVRWR